MNKHHFLEPTVPHNFFSHRKSGKKLGTRNLQFQKRTKGSGWDVYPKSTLEKFQVGFGFMIPVSKLGTNAGDFSAIELNFNREKWIGVYESQPSENRTWELSCFEIH